MSIEPTPEVEHHTDLDATDARQGRRGMHVLVVLVASLALVAIAYVVIYAFHAGAFAGRHGGEERVTSSAARAFNGPMPAAKVDDQGQAGHSPPPAGSEPSATTPS